MFAELHDELRAIARDLLTKGDDDTAEWKSIADAGWLGLEVPEDLGGAGATFAEVAVVLEEMGRSVTVAPYLGTAVLGVGALGLVEPSPARDGLLGRLATGEVRMAVALGPTSEDVEPRPPFRIDRVGDGERLWGRAEFVADAAGADQLLLLAVDPDQRPVMVCVAPGAVEVTPQPVLDATRRLGVVAADGVALAGSIVCEFAGEPQSAAQHLLDRGAVAVACDGLGLATAMLEATVSYAGQRHQFDRPIGSFQAVKHACADMLVEVSVARELLAVAVAAVATGADRDAAVARAKSFVSAMAVDVVGKALQLHGGIGYTWESGIHTYLKRALLDRAMFGSPRAHRGRLAEVIVEASDGDPHPSSIEE